MGIETRKNRHHWAAYLLPIALLLLTSCATSSTGKLYQVGDVLDSLIVKATEYCTDGRLSQPDCANISIGADEAVAAWKVARIFISEGNESSAWLQMSGVASFILTTGANMQELGMPVPENVLGYISVIVGRE